jgi:predicted site-specific integrase-resolvase
MQVMTAPLLTTGHAARELGIHYETAREWIAKGWLKPVVTLKGGPGGLRRRFSMLELRLAKARRKGL